jgi:hypothetical protein
MLLGKGVTSSKSKSHVQVRICKGLSNINETHHRWLALGGPRLVLTKPSDLSHASTTPLRLISPATSLPNTDE